MPILPPALRRALTCATLAAVTAVGCAEPAPEPAFYEPPRDRDIEPALRACRAGEVPVCGFEQMVICGTLDGVEHRVAAWWPGARLVQETNGHFAVWALPHPYYDDHLPVWHTLWIDLVGRGTGRSDFTEARRVDGINVGECAGARPATRLRLAPNLLTFHIKGRAFATAASDWSCQAPVTADLKACVWLPDGHAELWQATLDGTDYVIPPSEGMGSD